MFVFFLSGCQSDKPDLNKYIQEVKARPAKGIEPLPVMKPYEKFTYAASDLRNPFTPTVIEAPVKEEVSPNLGNGISPDANRLKEALESYRLAELQFVGTLGKEDVWALVRTSDGVIHRVQEGNYMGENHGRIISISDTQLTLDEIVSDGKGAYIKRESYLTMADVN
jgi:type IV pilus assembly protein PilP